MDLRAEQGSVAKHGFGLPLNNICKYPGRKRVGKRRWSVDVRGVAPGRG
jgi:hypothetical protein